jgi:hypothetical protein
VRKPGGGSEWQAASDLAGNARVDTVASADYGVDSVLSRALVLAVDKICAQIALCELGAPGP